MISKSSTVTRNGTSPFPHSHHSKILSLAHICLHLLAYFFLFIFSFYFLILKTETLLLLTHNQRLIKAFTCYFVHALVIISACVSFFRQISPTLQSFLIIKKRGTGQETEKDYTYTISFQKYTHMCTREYLQNFITIYMHTCLVYTHTNNNELYTDTHAHA